MNVYLISTNLFRTVARFVSFLMKEKHKNQLTMKKILLTGIVILSTLFFAKAQTGHINNIVNNTSANRSSALGQNNRSTGLNSIVGGSYSLADDSHAFAFGKYVNATASNSIVFGMGQSNVNRLANNIANSFMIGFNTTTPSFFVRGFDKESPGYVGVFTTNPQSELDVKGTITTTGLKLAPGFGGKPVKPGDVLTAINGDGTVGWSTPSGSGGGPTYWKVNNKDIYFKTIDDFGSGNDGKVGIGTDSPKKIACSDRWVESHI